MQPAPAAVSPTVPAVPVTTRHALVAASGDDVFVRCSVPPDEQVEAWADGGRLLACAALTEHVPGVARRVYRDLG